MLNRTLAKFDRIVGAYKRSLVTSKSLDSSDQPSIKATRSSWTSASAPDVVEIGMINDCHAPILMPPAITAKKCRYSKAVVMSPFKFFPLTVRNSHVC